jgi:hypothetical protein
METKSITSSNQQHPNEHPPKAWIQMFVALSTVVGNAHIDPHEKLVVMTTYVIRHQLDMRMHDMYQVSHQV